MSTFFNKRASSHPDNFEEVLKCTVGIAMVTVC